MKTADHRMSPTRCVACGYLTDGATGVGTEDSPQPGEWSICLRCGHLQAFDDKLQLRNLTDAEAYEAAGDKIILAAQKARGNALAQLPPEDDWVRDFCQPNNDACCRYLTMSPTGWSCEKHNPRLKSYIDRRVERGQIRAVGDNCPGRASR